MWRWSNSINLTFPLQMALLGKCKAMGVNAMTTPRRTALNQILKCPTIQSRAGWRHMGCGEHLDMSDDDLDFEPEYRRTIEDDDDDHCADHVLGS